MAWEEKGEYDKALADYRQAVLCSSPMTLLRTVKAIRLRATCLDEKYRDGKKAVAAASKACDLGGWKQWDNLDPHCCGVCRERRLREGKEWEAKAIELAPGLVNQAGVSRRLLLYKQQSLGVNRRETRGLESSRWLNGGFPVLILITFRAATSERLPAKRIVISELEPRCGTSGICLFFQHLSVDT